MAAAREGQEDLKAQGKSHHTSLINDLTVLMPPEVVKLVFTMTLQYFLT